MIALVEFDDLVAGTIRSAVTGEIQQYQDLRELRTGIADQPMETVILGPSVDQQAACEFASAFRAKRPEMGVILVRPRLDTVIVTEAIRAGIRDVIADRDMTQLNEAVKRSERVTRELLHNADTPAEETQRGRVVTVFSAKGGCGKTTTATNLAAYLASTERGSVALVDLDLSFGDVSIAMLLEPKHSIADAVTMGDQIDSTALLGMLAKHPSGVHVLAAPPTPEIAEKVHESLVSEVLSALALSFDYVVVDTPPAMDGPTLAAFDSSDTIALLTTLDVPSLKNTKLSLETLKALGFDTDRMRLVLNRADAKVGLNPSDVADALGLEVTGHLPSSRDVPASTNQGDVLVQKDPKHPFSLALASFADSQIVTGSSNNEAEADKPRRSLFRRKS